MTTELTASSKCPVCGMDKPHTHTKYSLAIKYREEWLQERFEQFLPHWFFRYKDVLPGSYGMGTQLSHKANNGTCTYWWWPVEMLWNAYCSGARLFSPPLPDGAVPDVNEALDIKAYPFGKDAGDAK